MNLTSMVKRSFDEMVELEELRLIRRVVLRQVDYLNTLCCGEYNENKDFKLN